MITIHWNFTDGTEVSYSEGLELKDNFNTCCLDFFCFDTPTEVRIIDSYGNCLERDELLESNIYTDKAINKSHNLQKMLKAGTFNWRTGYKCLEEIKTENGITQFKEGKFYVMTGKTKGNIILRDEWSNPAELDLEEIVDKFEESEPFSNILVDIINPEEE